jgi:hypothetical protein
VALCVLWVVVGVGAAGMFMYDHWWGPWPDVRRSVAEFGVPAEFTEVATIEAGNEACIISCGAPRVAVVLTTPLSPSEACATLETETNRVAEHMRRSAPPKFLIKEASCYIKGDLPKVGPDACLTAVVFSGEDLPAYSNLLANANTPPLPPGATVVAVVFNSHNRLELDRPLDTQ